MKKIIFASVALAGVVGSFDANAAVACGNVSPAGNGSTVTTAAGSFVVTAFVPKCSANTFVNYTDGGSYFAVGSAALKGKTTFAGSTAGGGVSATGTCTTAGACSATDAGTALSSAPTS